MIQYTQTFIPTFIYPQERLTNLSDFLFLDIETTGFSRTRNTIYLIGCAYFKKQQWHLIQWFAQTPQEEPQILTAFLTFAWEYSGFIHFNGTRFDIPFIQARIEKLGILKNTKSSTEIKKIKENFTNYQEIDFFQMARKYQKIFNLANCKQKSVEQFLQIHRKDQYTGKELIEVYQRYATNPNDADLGLLLLHNGEDIIGMTGLMDLFCYHDFLERSLIFETYIDRQEYLILEYHSDTTLPQPLQYDIQAWKIRAQGNHLHLMIPLFEEEMKYYYPNPADYYYLPNEDQAIHKNLACFVDKEYRQKATKQTCYLRKSGRFLPISKKLTLPASQPIFRRTYKASEHFLLLQENFFHDTKLITQYLYALLH